MSIDQATLGELLFIQLARTPTAVRNWFAVRRLRTLLRETRSYPLELAPENVQVRVTGIVEFLEKRSIEAPLSGRPCVYYRLTIESQTEDGMIRRVLATEQDAVSFALDVDGRRAAVDPSHVVILAGGGRIVSSKRPSPRAVALLTRYAQRHNGLVVCREVLLEIEERITLVGIGTREIDPDALGLAGYRDSGPARLRFAGTVKSPLVISRERS